MPKLTRVRINHLPSFCIPIECWKNNEVCAGTSYAHWRVTQDLELQNLASLEDLANRLANLEKKA